MNIKIIPVGNIMTKEEAKQYLRDQINSCIKMQSDHIENEYYLCYNKQYLRALKFSKITVQPVNKEDFNGGEILFGFDSYNKHFWLYSIIRKYLNDNYSNDYPEQKKIVAEVFKEYDEYKGYKTWW